MEDIQKPGAQSHGAASNMNGKGAEQAMQTRVLHVETSDLGHFEDRKTLRTWKLKALADSQSSNLSALEEAAKHLRESNIPVGFPTETVYGLGADATRSEAVRGIYRAKGRPSDNPLIIHVCDLTMLQGLLGPAGALDTPSLSTLPDIYQPLISEFWPGPLTILLPNPSPSKLAPEVTAGLPTFGARMPDSPLALSLIRLAGVPLAAPSANASTKPSPTTAAHVLHDLNGKIDLILDGGACTVGVESTVVDGLCDPPVVLRPGGISIDAIRKCPGWKDVQKGYKDQSEVGASAPRAPGMKYKHYSPKAKVILYEPKPNGDVHEHRAGISEDVWTMLEGERKEWKSLGNENQSIAVKIGIVSTQHWRDWAGLKTAQFAQAEADIGTWADNHGQHLHSGSEVREDAEGEINNVTTSHVRLKTGQLWQGNPKDQADSVVDDGPGHSNTSLSGKAVVTNTVVEAGPQSRSKQQGEHIADLTEIALGPQTKEIAHGLFSALRELDQRGVDVIYVEGIGDEGEGDISAAVMNRLRKAATVIKT